MSTRIKRISTEGGERKPDVSLMAMQQKNFSREMSNCPGANSLWLPVIKSARFQDAKKIKRKKVKSHCLSARERKKCSLFDPTNHDIKFDSVIPLNLMWEQYMSTLFPTPQSLMNINRLYKIELTGAALIVSKSKCDTNVGMNGIVVQDLKNSLRIICPDDKLKLIPKMGSVFVVHVLNKELRLKGEYLANKSYERSRGKIKFQNIK